MSAGFWVTPRPEEPSRSSNGIETQLAPPEFPPPSNAPIFMYITPSTSRASIAPTPSGPPGTSDMSMVIDSAGALKSSSPLIGSENESPEAAIDIEPEKRAVPAASAAAGDADTSARVETFDVANSVPLPQADIAATVIKLRTTVRRMKISPIKNPATMMSALADHD